MDDTGPYTAGVLAWSVATFVTPIGAAAGAAPLVLARIALGVGEGVAFPAIHTMISRHVPRDRHSTAVAGAYTRPLFSST
jgi:ACS family sodium-dependent inorganic phosphate cotransporter